MDWQPPEGMDEYLKPTELCDCDNPDIRQKAREIVKDAKTQKEAAIKIFYFVRDEIKFGWDFFDVRASGTLKKKMGMCTNKTILQIALLRSVEIPARWGAVPANREAVKPVSMAMLYKSLPEILEHTFCEVYLDKWLANDTLFDKPLVEKVLREITPSPSHQ